MWVPGNGVDARFKTELGQGLGCTGWLRMGNRRLAVRGYVRGMLHHKGTSLIRNSASLEP
jgi:hypothetical protein